MDKIDNLIKNPQQHFTHPQEVCSHPSLTHKQKIAILRQWEYDARELSVAEEENMGGGEPSLLQAVLTALRQLDPDYERNQLRDTKQ